ncbi:MAG TPA: hypothetical protein VHK88_09000 [Aquihabitans sp.]|jgi:hypothetical protein|nr:hypothetical protein [Aquihabitans sp.]
MHAIHPRTHPAEHATASSEPFAWEEAHAAPEDRAVGLELELIELVARRKALVDEYGGEARALDAEIEHVLAELGSITTALPLAG